jgi:hypothetical protein
MSFPAGTQELSPDSDGQEAISFDAIKPPVATRRNTKKKTR